MICVKFLKRCFTVSNLLCDKIQLSISVTLKGASAVCIFKFDTDILKIDEKSSKTDYPVLPKALVAAESFYRTSRSHYL